MNLVFKNRKPADDRAAEIKWGIELETIVPIECGVTVGLYHRGEPVIRGRSATPNAAGYRVWLLAPECGGNYWRAESDRSIEKEPGYIACEFVSPVLCGAEGLSNLLAFLMFAESIGARVNSSCGCHITIGIKSVTGSWETYHVTHFLRKLARIVTQHAWAIYAQTGIGRHANKYAKPLPQEAGELTNAMTRAHGSEERQQLATDCGRGILNMKKAFLHGDLGAVEFRAFAGTLDAQTITHHLATALGLVRRAANSKHVPVFGRQRNPWHTAPDALVGLWQYLGWTENGLGVDCAYGQFGHLHWDFPEYSKTAMKMAARFEDHWPRMHI